MGESNLNYHEQALEALFTDLDAGLAAIEDRSDLIGDQIVELYFDVQTAVTKYTHSN